MVYALEVITNKEAGLLYGLINSKNPNATNSTTVVFSSTLPSYSFLFFFYEIQFLLLFPKKSNTKYMDIWVKALLPNDCQETMLKRFQDLSPPTTFILLNYLN